MTHIFSKKHGFVFVHIPKNGGSTVRESLFHLDDMGKVFGPSEYEHPELGPVWLGHLPLWAIEKYYHDHFQVLKTSWAFALTRDPFQRFASAVAQRGRRFFDTDVSVLSEADLHKEAARVAEILTASSTLPPVDCCHFTRQTDFVVDRRGGRLVEIFPLERFDLLVRQLAARKKLALDNRIVNATKIARSGAALGAAQRVWRGVKPLLSASAQARIRAALRPIFMTNRRDHQLDFVYRPPTRDFIEKYYKEDFCLHQDALAAVATARGG